MRPPIETPAGKMKILINILSHKSSTNRLNACLNTWAKNIAKPHELIILGDSKMNDKISGINVFKPLQNESYKDLPEKIFVSYKYSLKKDWDYVVKIDDDAYLNFDSLLSFLDGDLPEPLYAGQGVHFPEKTHPCYLSNIGDKLPPETFTYYYAQGGCYIISRKALKSSIKHMNINSPFAAEDIMVGIAMHKSGIQLHDRPDLFNSGYKGKGWHEMGTRKHTSEEHIEHINSGYISTHALTAKQIYKIHEQSNKNI